VFVGLLVKKFRTLARIMGEISRFEVCRLPGRRFVDLHLGSLETFRLEVGKL
jgi:hypothetical protein